MDVLCSSALQFCTPCALLSRARDRLFFFLTIMLLPFESYLCFCLLSLSPSSHTDIDRNDILINVCTIVYLMWLIVAGGLSLLHKDHEPLNWVLEYIVGHIIICDLNVNVRKINQSGHICDLLVTSTQ